MLHHRHPPLHLYPHYLFQIKYLKFPPIELWLNFHLHHQIRWKYTSQVHRIQYANLSSFMSFSHSFSGSSHYFSAGIENPVFLKHFLIHLLVRFLHDQHNIWIASRTITCFNSSFVARFASDTARNRCIKVCSIVHFHTTNVIV